VGERGERKGECGSMGFRGRLCLFEAALWMLWGVVGMDTYLLKYIST